MSKKANQSSQGGTRPPDGFAQRASWLPMIVVALIAGLVGATVTFFFLRPSSDVTPPPTPVAALPNSDPTAHRPDPSLTAGKTPAEAARTLGNFYYDHENWPEAITQYESAVRQGSDDADIRTDLGNAYRFGGRPEEALRQYEFAQRLNPNHEFSLFNQAGLYLESFNQPAKALEVWQTYLARFPNGRSAVAARQFIAQLQAGAAAPPATQSSNAPSNAESVILKQIEAARSKPAKP